MSALHKITNRLEKYILHQATIKSFSLLANEIGVTEGNIRAIFKQNIINMNQYENKFHVVRMVNVAMETVRKDVRALLSNKQRIDLKNDRFLLYKRQHTLSTQEYFKINYWLNKYELLSHAYIIKEDFYKIYNAYEKNKAYDIYENWELQITEDFQQYFQPIITSIRNWHKEIFNYFDYPVTNGETILDNCSCNIGMGAASMTIGYASAIEDAVKDFTCSTN